MMHNSPRWRADPVTSKNFSAISEGVLRKRFLRTETVLYLVGARFFLYYVDGRTHLYQQDEALQIF